MFTQRRSAVSYRRFETTNQSHFKGQASNIKKPLKIGPTGSLETSVNKSQCMVRNIPEERILHLFHVGNL